MTPQLLNPSTTFHTSTEADEDTIFNRANFRAIYHRTQKIKQHAQRLWGKMNLVQMLNHLKVATGCALNVYHLKDESTFLTRVIVKFIALRILKRLPKSAKAPEGFKIEMNNTLDFNTEKEQALKMLIKAHYSAEKTYHHPLFGKMTRDEWGKLIYRHYDHHLRQFGS